MAQARTDGDQRTIDDLRDIDVEDAIDYAEELRREEERYVLDPTYRAPLIENRGFIARANFNYFDFTGDNDGLTEEEREEIEFERMRQFRENCETICEIIDDALGVDDDYDPLMDWRHDTDWDSDFEYQTWDELVDQNPDLFVDTGFTCGITEALRDELYGTEFGSVYEPEPEPAYLTYDINPVTGEQTELTQEQKIDRRIAYDADQTVKQATSLTMVDDIIKDVSRQAATQPTSPSLISTDLNLTESFTTATTAPAPSDDPAPTEPDVATAQPVVKQPEAAPAL